MWIMTPIGFYSAVAHRDLEHHLLVRARSRHDLIELAKFGRDTVGVDLSQADIETLDDADYPFRLLMLKASWAKIVAALALSIDYDNFKSEVERHNPERAHTYHDVWYTLHQIENEDAAARPLEPGLDPDVTRRLYGYGRRWLRGNRRVE